MSVLAEVFDPDGRRVALTEERWQHICDGHPELAALQAEVLRAIQTPSRRLGGSEPAEEWFYLAGPGPSRWLKVVVLFAGESGRIIPSFPGRALP